VSNFLKASREEIKLQLNSVLLQNGQDIKVYEFVPERPSLPCFVISPSSPYISQGTAFCDFSTRFEVLILADKLTNERATDLLDQLIVEAIDALETWFIEEVEQPSAFEVNGGTFLGTKIQLTADKSL
jgi:hypothetical protein